MLSQSKQWLRSLAIGVLWIGLVGVGSAQMFDVTYYVSPTGNDANHGTNWTSPKLTIQNAISMVDVATVLVTNGTYTLASQIDISKNVTVKSMNGAAVTVINGAQLSRCFHLNSTLAVVDGFTITNGCDTTWRGAGVCINNGGGTVKNCTISGNILDRANEGGGGVAMMAGLVSNCTIVGNTAHHGGGVNIDGGTVRDCTISDNSSSGASTSGGGGGGVWLSGGTVWNCTISGNWGNTAWGAGVNNSGGTVRNCLIMGNYTTASQGGWQSGSTVQNSGTMESCTIVGNFGPTYSPNGPWDQQQWYSVYNQDGATMKNCIVVNNTPGFGNSGSRCTYSCTTPLVSGTGNIMQDPQFVNPGSGSGSSFVAGNYQLMAYSPCINAGVNVAWMNSAKDLAGNARIFNTTVDIGAYEYPAVAPTRIAAPANVAATDGIYGDKVRVTWSPVVGAIGYVVYRGSDGSNVDFSASMPAPASPYNDTNVVPGVIYYYWVAASDANGRSALSAGNRGYASLYGVNFDGAQVVFLDGDKHLKKINTNGIVSAVFTATNPVIDKILFNQQGDLFIAFPQNMGGPGGQGGVVLNDGYTNILAKATPTNNTIIGVDHEILQLMDWGSYCWNGQMSSPSIQVDDAGNAYYFAVSEWTTTGPKVKLRKYFNGTTNIVDLIPGDNIQVYNWNVRKDGTVLIAGKTMSTSSDWFKKVTPANNVVTVIAPPVRTLFVATFPDDMVYVGIEFWHYNDADWNCPGVYRLPPDISNPQFSFPYIGNSNYYGNGGGPGPGGPQQQVFTPEYDVNDILAGHGSTWSSGFGRMNGTRITQLVTTSDNKVFVLAADWQGAKTLVQYYPTVEIIELKEIEMVTLIEPLGDKLVIAGTLGTQQKLILWDNGYEDNLLTEEIEIFHLQTMYTGHIWFDGWKYSGNKYIAGRFTYDIVYSADGKTSLQTPKGGNYMEVVLGVKPSAFVGVVANTNSGVIQTTPSAPTGVAASDGTYSDKIRVTWRATAGATSYEVYRHTSNNSGAATKLGDASSVGYEDTTAEADVYYYYWVKAVNSSGSSGYSASDTGCLGTGCMDIAGDFDGDRIADPALVSMDGNWYAWMSSAGFSKAGPFPLSVGIGTGTALAGDFDGDGKSDPVWVSGNNWYAWMSASGYQRLGPIPIGTGSYTPVVGDFDGDRIADPVMVDKMGWTFLLSGSGYAPLGPVQFSRDGSYFLAGDMDGDRLADPITVNGAGLWQIYYSANGYMAAAIQYGMAGSTPVVGDFDGDGKTDIVCVNGMGDWYVYYASAGFSVANGPYRLVP